MLHSMEGLEFGHVGPGPFIVLHFQLQEWEAGGPVSAQSTARPQAPRASESDSAGPNGSMAKAPAARESSNAAASADSRVSSAMPAPMSQSLARAAPAPKLGTGHGEREYSYVNHTEFSRMQDQPNEVIRIRYDSLDNLLAMGIIRRPRPAAPTANPFPASPEQQYVPDPPG